jgi:hypothetical protein
MMKIYTKKYDHFVFPLKFTVNLIFKSPITYMQVTVLISLYCVLIFFIFFLIFLLKLN